MTIEAANADAHAARRSALRRAALSNDLEAERVELDRLIAQVEEANLGLRSGLGADFRPRLRRLARALAVPVPVSIWRAPAGARVHEALMQWQGALLDRLAPQRLSYTDRSD